MAAIDIGKAFRVWIITKTAVSNLVGTRVRPDVLAQSETMPAVAYYVISGTDEMHFTGALGNGQARIQVDCYAETRTAANALSNAIRDECMAVNHTAWDSVSVTSSYPEGGERYDTQTVEAGSDKRHYVTSRDFFISYVE